MLTGCSNIVESAVQKIKAHDFALQDIENETVKLSDYKNKVVVLNFFATWCPPCRNEIPDFIELVNEYSGKDFVIIGIALDKGGLETVRNFADSYNVNYPMLLDDGIVSDTYGPIVSIPTTFIIDKERNIVEKIIGARNKDYFKDIVKPLL
jgi:cytochrome c biogenesis protein CcmG/thiol:disulfide interchange protein DsbE